MSMITVTCMDMNNIQKYQKAGADEILIALKGAAFTALPSYTLEEIREINEKADACGLKTAVLMNRLYPQTAVNQIKIGLEKLKEMEVNAIWFADPALYRAAEELGITDKLVYMPGTLLTDKGDAFFWMSLNIQSAVLSPLVTKEEVQEIGSAVGNITVQLHGRFAMSYSARGLLSAYEENAKNSRHLSLQEETRKENMPIFEDEFGTIIYTDFIQESFAEAATFQESGIQRFYITSMYADEDSTLAAIIAYRRVLNGDEASIIEKEYREQFKELPLSDGYYGQATIK